MESAEQVLDEIENLDEDQENEEDQPDLNAPLELLSSVSARLLRGEIPTNPRRLQSLFEHIQSVVGDVVEASFAKMSSALDEMETAHEALRGEGEDESEEAQVYFEAFELGREHIEEALAIMQESFFSAENFEDLQEFEEEFREAEVQLAEGLARVETALMQIDNPELFDVSPLASSEFVEHACGAFANSLDALSEHLTDGEPHHLKFVLAEIEKARGFVEAALAEVESDEEEADEEEAV
ncbi:MAG TPA: hypothetical protein EYO33_20485 [Phycisphaerales bacterium]|nr:hypothetical protein [Phycisphaerales bacterium]